MDKILEALHGFGIVPVIKVERVEDAEPLAKALVDGGLPVAEVTFRTEAAAEAIAVMRKAFPHMLVGAGTVTSIQLAEKAVAAGATYLITPGFNPDVVRWCLDHNMPVFPGISSASELETAQNMGLKVVKFFPAEQSGGLDKIKALAGPYPTMRFMPTGGIGLHNLAAYLANPKIVACGGSFMVGDALVNTHDWAGITALTRKALSEVLRLELGHVGLYADSASEGLAMANQLGALTGKPVDDRGMGVFVGEDIEIIKSPSAWKGHIGYATPSVERAVFQFRQRGYAFDEASAFQTPDGVLRRIYFLDVIGGFAVHLFQK